MAIGARASRTTRASPATSLGSSMRNTAAILVCAASLNACAARGPSARGPSSRPLARAHRQILQLRAICRIDFDLLAGMHLGRERDPLGPLDRLFPRSNLDDPVAADHLLGFGERPVDHGALGAAELHPHAFCDRREAVDVEQHAGALQLVVVTAHRFELRRVGDAGVRGGGGLDDHHETHRGLLGGCVHRGDERPARGSTRARKKASSRTRCPSPAWLCDSDAALWSGPKRRDDERAP